MSDDLTRELVRVKIEKAREAMGEATWCFDGDKYPAAVNRLYYAIYPEFPSFYTYAGASTPRHR